MIPDFRHDLPLPSRYAGGTGSGTTRSSVGETGVLPFPDPAARQISTHQQTKDREIANFSKKIFFISTFLGAHLGDFCGFRAAGHIFSCVHIYCSCAHIL